MSKSFRIILYILLFILMFVIFGNQKNPFSIMNITINSINII